VRRWEPRLGPLLSRLGLVRPDLNPIQASDEARIVYPVGNAAFAVPHPGQYVTAWAVETPIVVGQFQAAYMTPPADGAFILGVMSGPESFRLFWGTEPDSIPDGGFPPLTPTAFSTQKQIFRPDNRESFFPMKIEVGNDAVGSNVWTDLQFDGQNSHWFPGPGWFWHGCRLCITTGGPLYLKGGLQAKLQFTIYLAIPIQTQVRAQVGAPAT